MNPNWVWVFLGFQIWLLAAVAVVVIRIRGIRRELQRSQTEAADLRSMLESLRSEVAKPKVETRSASFPAPDPVRAASFPAPAVLSPDRRAEALEMLRSGMDSAAVSARLQLSEPEAALLKKVQTLLGPAADR